MHRYLRGFPSFDLDVTVESRIQRVQNFFFGEKFGSELLHLFFILHCADSCFGVNLLELVASDGFCTRGLNFCLDCIFDSLVGYLFDYSLHFGFLVVLLSVDFVRDVCYIRRQFFNAVLYHSQLVGTGCNVI